MKIGVSILPCGVVKEPSLAPLVLQVFMRLKCMADN